MSERLIVVGGDAAGMSAASQARRRRTSDDLEILVFERSSCVSYSACGEPYYVASYVTDIGQLPAYAPAVLTRGPAVLERTLDPDMGALVTQRMRAIGIEVLPGIGSTRWTV